MEFSLRVRTANDLACHAGVCSFHAREVCAPILGDIQSGGLGVRDDSGRSSNHRPSGSTLLPIETSAPGPCCHRRPAASLRASWTEARCISAEHLATSWRRPSVEESRVSANAYTRRCDCSHPERFLGLLRTWPPRASRSLRTAKLCAARCSCTLIIQVWTAGVLFLLAKGSDFGSVGVARRRSRVPRRRPTAGDSITPHHRESV